MGSNPYKNEDWLRREYVDKGRTLGSMADECNVSRPTIADWMDKYSIERRGRKEAQQADGKYTNKEWLREKYGSGNSTHDIADECGVTGGTILKWLRRFDIDTRDTAYKARVNHASFYTTKTGYEKVGSRYKQENDACTVHQLVSIANGANPHKVFSNGRYHVHHKNGVKWDNRPCSLELKSAHVHQHDHNAAEEIQVSPEAREELEKDRLLTDLSHLMGDWRESDSKELDIAADELEALLESHI